MAGQAPTYDLMLLLDGDAPEDTRSRVLGEVRQAISGSGTMVGEHDWGRRRTAYEIAHRAEAEYHLLQFQGSPELLESLQRSLRISDGVVRFRLIKLDPGTPPVPEGRPPEFAGAPREGRGDRDRRGEPREPREPAAAAPAPEVAEPSDEGSEPDQAAPQAPDAPAPDAPVPDGAEAGEGS